MCFKWYVAAILNCFWFKHNIEINWNSLPPQNIVSEANKSVLRSEIVFFFILVSTE